MYERMKLVQKVRTTGADSMGGRKQGTNERLANSGRDKMTRSATYGVRSLKGPIMCRSIRSLGHWFRIMEKCRRTHNVLGYTE